MELNLQELDRVLKFSRQTVLKHLFQNALLRATR